MAGHGGAGAGGNTPMPRFAAIGLDHRHIYDPTQGLLDAGAAGGGYNLDTPDPRVLAGFQKRFPHVPSAPTARLLDDPGIDFVALGELTSPATQAALRVVHSGEIGRLLHITALAPHRLNRALRPAWFFDHPAYGGIVNDIGSHSIAQFLAF